MAQFRLDLAQLVARLGPLPVADACELIRQAALGLQYAHEHGLVHRDIKPSNLMLAVSGQRIALSGQRSAFSQTVATSGQGRGETKLTADSRPLTAAIKILDLGLALLDAEAANGGEMTGSSRQRRRDDG